MITDQAQSRYEIVREVGSGSFATVYAARDLKLGRDVAIKQIHSHFLTDEEKLSRYWQEAQLLASLEHPHVMTIYDVIESRGCLVLELMQGSLKQLYRDQPMPLQDVRQTLLQAAHGLHFLHARGIIHGDVKPGNLLLSRQNLIKLGDFGLARRASDTDGSLVKGTTKYMAPELASDQFGPVGPASDLYSLGFAALELMCGPEFDLLFPGLTAFGRDQQLAWMLWHSAQDRRLPDLRSIMEGLPNDLAQVLQRLTAKDQTQRYRTAQEMLADLAAGGAAPAAAVSDKEAEAAAAAEQAAQKKRRLVAITAFAASVVLSVALLFVPTEKQPTPEPEPALPPPIQGVLQSVMPDEQRFVVAVGDDWKEISLFREDRVILNRRERPLRDLQPGDRVVVRTLFNPQRRPIQEIIASRPETHRGAIARLQADEGQFVLLVEEGDDAGAELTIQAPVSVSVTLNGQARFGGKPVELATLRPGDRITVQHAPGQAGRTALALAAQRIVAVQGVVRDVDSARGELTFALGESAEAELLTLPIAERCEITLNGLRFLNGQLLKLIDLRPGDRVSLQRDVQIVAMDAYRQFHQQGVLRRIAYDTRTLEVQVQGAAEPRLFVLAPDCRVTLGGEPAEATDLRLGDALEFTHDSPDNKTPPLLTLDALRPPDPSKWALLIANQNFDDATLSPLEFPRSSVRRLRERLISRYALRPEQALMLEDESRVRLEQGAPAFLGRVPANAELYVYVATHAYVEPGDTVYLAAKDFALQRKSDTGLKLDWLIDLLEACPARQKLLLLDCCHAGAGADLAQQPATAEMVERVIGNHPSPYLRSSHVLASCSAGQRGLTVDNSPSLSVFAACLVEGFSGAADKARDNRLEVTELSQYVEQAAASMASRQSAVQQPRLFLPDATPPRLTEEAKQAIRRLLAAINQSKLDPRAVRLEAEMAARLAKGQPEPMLAYGLLLIKARQRDEALRVLEQVRIEHDDVLLAHQAVAWIHFDKRDYNAGLAALQTVVSRVPLPESDDAPANAATLSMFEWIGRLRELAASATWFSRQPSPQLVQSLDQGVARHGAAVQQRYEAGRAAVRSILAELERRVAEDPSSQPRVNLQKMNSTTYATFSPEAAAVVIRNRLND